MQRSGQRSRQHIFHGVLKQTTITQHNTTLMESAFVVLHLTLPITQHNTMLMESAIIVSHLTLPITQHNTTLMESPS